MKLNSSIIPNPVFAKSLVGRSERSRIKCNKIHLNLAKKHVANAEEVIYLIKLNVEHTYRKVLIIRPWAGHLSAC